MWVVMFSTDWQGGVESSRYFHHEENALQFMKAQQEDPNVYWKGGNYWDIQEVATEDEK